MTCAVQGSQTVEVQQGETVTLQLSVVDTDGNPVDLATTTVWFTVRRRPGDARLLIQKDSSDIAEVEILSPTADGIANIMLVHDDTKNLRPDTYAFDAWIAYPGGAVHPVIEPSPFIVTPTVTTFA